MTTGRVTAARNPFLDEGARTYFSHAPVLRSYLFAVGLSGLALLVWWPRESLVAVLRTGRAPDTFAAAATGLYAALAYLGARYGSEAYAPESVRKIQEYVTLTPVPLLSIVLGKAAFAFLHTLFLLVLGAPLLAASLAVSGLSPVAALEALLVIGAATLAARAYGLVLLVLLGSRRGLRESMLLIGIVAFFGLSIGLYPPSNPVVALVWVSTRGRSPGGALRQPFPSAGYFWFSVLLDILAACLLICVAWWSLAAMRRRAREAGRG
jgi:ABC-type transport system involved in cytochrome c biogenesis permease component